MKRPIKETEPEFVKTTIRVKRELWDRVQHFCIDERLSLQEVLERALTTYLKGGQK